MKITIQGFGLLGPMLGEQAVELEESATVADVMTVLTATNPDFAVHHARTATAVGDQLVPANTVLRDGQTLVLIPPVGGG
ncbi:MAG: sulfur carrier protein ThiS [Pseudoalteromonas tetraodonis]|jgi:sulfur carrier protein ThiS